MAEPSRYEQELAVLELLRSRFESDGFTYIIHPNAEMLPAFMSGYQPDAVATKSNKSVAIEIKETLTPQTSAQVKRIAKLFDGRDDWEWKLFFTSAFRDQIATPTFVSDENLQAAKGRIEKLCELKFDREAFVAAWVLFEAAFHRYADIQPLIKSRSGLGPMRIVSSLAEVGEISPNTATRLRTLANVRTKIVHGDYDIAIPDKATQLLIETADKLVRRRL